MPFVEFSGLLASIRLPLGCGVSSHFHLLGTLPDLKYWSLSIVELFVLQVGLSFLSGLSFAVILIPINRKLAIKIGQLSKCMMHHKDCRVKVCVMKCMICVCVL